MLNRGTLLVLHAATGLSLALAAPAMLADEAQAVSTSAPGMMSRHPESTTNVGLRAAFRVAADRQDVGTSAMRASGALQTWGYNGDGEFGIGDSPSDSSVPLPIGGLPPVSAVAGSRTNGYALLADGTVRAWGANNAGQLGNGTYASSNTPVVVSGLSGVTAIASGGYTAYALLQDGTVRSWGDNSYGELGNGDSGGLERNTPVSVSGLTRVAAIASGARQGYALLKDGTVRAWGSNGYGELGDGNTTGSSIPVHVSGLTGVTAIASGESTGYALLKNRTVRAWGSNYDGALGNGQKGDGSTTPLPVSRLTNVTGVSGGGYSGYALLSDGTVRAWGYNYYGQLGNGTTRNSGRPVRVSNLRSAVAIVAGANNGYALLASGAVQSWGSNGYGELGNGTSSTRSSVPVLVSGLTGVTALASASETAFALKAHG